MLYLCQQSTYPCISAISSVDWETYKLALKFTSIASYLLQQQDKPLLQQEWIRYINLIRDRVLHHPAQAKPNLQVLAEFFNAYRDNPFVFPKWLHVLAQFTRIKVRKLYISSARIYSHYILGN